MKSELKTILTESFVPFLIFMLSAVLFLYYIDNLIEEISMRPRIIDLDSQREENLEISSIKQQLPVEGLPEKEAKKIMTINTLVFQRDYKKAVDRMKDLPGQTEGREDVKLLMAYCYMKAGKSAEGISVLDSLMEEKHSPRVYFYYGLIYAESPDTYDRAIENYGKYLASDSKSYEAILNMGIIHYKKKEFARASELFRQAADISSGRRRSLAVYRMGLCQNEMGNSTLAEETFNSAIKLDPMNLRARKKLASIMYKRSPEEGIEEYGRILKLNNTYTYGYYFTGKHYLDSGDIMSAINILKEGINTASDSSSLKSLLGRIYLDQMDYDNAKDLYEQLVAEKPDDKTHHFNLARAYYGMRNYNSAIAEYLEALRHDPGYYKAIQNLGVAYARVDNTKEALKYYTRASKIEPNSPVTFYNLGLLYQKTGKNAEAIHNFNRAISLQPEYPAVYLNLGLVYSRMNDTEKAVKYYETAISQDRKYALPYMNLSILYRKTAKPEMEEKTLREGVSSTGDIKLKAMLASFLHGKKDLDNALRIYMEIHSSDQSDTAALMGISQILLEKREFDRCIDYIKKYLFHQPTDCAGRYINMVALFNMQQYEQAEHEIEIITNLKPGFNDVETYRAWIREKTGR